MDLEHLISYNKIAVELEKQRADQFLEQLELGVALNAQQVALAKEYCKIRQQIDKLTVLTDLN